MKKIITHNAGFHTDDVFAVATLLLLLNNEAEVVRTRDPEIIKTGDFVVDVGMVYDPEKNLFDHHQKSGAGERENGIPYASFGLVWKKFGEKVSGSRDVANEIDKYIVQGIDAVDNGVNISKPLIPDTFLYSIWGLVGSYEPTWKELKDTNIDDKFIEAVDFAKGLLVREIKKTKDRLEAEDVIEDAYKKSEDKRLIILEEDDTFGRYLITRKLISFPEPIYFIFRKGISNQEEKDSWQLVAVNIDTTTFDLRKPLPENWRGKIGQDLVDITGVEGSEFCHNSGFICVTASKESAIKLAKLALEA
jgi:uncharacterized UPF0160 family protein